MATTDPVPDTAINAAITVDIISQMSYLTNKRARVANIRFQSYIYDQASAICIAR